MSEKIDKSEKQLFLQQAKMKIQEAIAIIEKCYSYNSSVELWVTDPLKEIVDEKMDKYLDELEDDY